MRDGFTLEVPFGEGLLLALTDPDTGTTRSLAYDAEVLPGSLTGSDGQRRELLWTRVTSRTAGYTGLAIDPRGDVTIVLVDARAPDGARTYALRRAGSLSFERGVCREAQH